MPRKPSQIYQIKVTLNETHPPIWRRIQVPANITLLKLHDILQIVMGWEGYHLHMFTIEGSVYGDPADDEFGDQGTLDEAKFKLSQVISREGQRFSYEYDFGDGWEHTLLVEKILAPQEGVHYPLCVKGKRAGPPEDVGGVWGYQSFLEAIRDPAHEGHEQYLAWIGGEFDSEAFDLEDVNAELHSMGRGTSAEDSSVWPEPGDELTDSELASPWPQALPVEQRLLAEELPLRRDVVVLVTYLRDNKVTGTQSTGNLPLKAVYEICARFVNPPQLEEAVGEHVYRARSETDVWPLYFRHVLAVTGGLVTGGLGQRWNVTPLGERFLAASAPWQVWLLLVTWWTRTNWGIAYPFDVDDYALAVFPQLALKHMLELPLGVRVSFERFADQMIKDCGMVWPIENQESARLILHSIIERVVVNPLADFGILQTEYELHKTLGAGFRDLSTCRLTPFGKGLLEAIRDAIERELP